jgi:simple sugar transport system ATP-binding protein
VGIRNVTKSFPGVIANDDVSLNVRQGLVHCLLGENGAGKSTLISILAGMQQPDSGLIEIDEKVARIASTRAAMKFGIGVVYQHSTLISSMTVLENLMLVDTQRLMLDKKGARSKLRDLSVLLGAEIDPETKARNLGLGQQQQVEIIKALWQGSRVLILDEPTSMLTPQAIESLLASVVKLRNEGLAVIFITHKLREAYAIGDEISVLRKGRMVKHVPADELATMNEEALKNTVLTAMFGDDQASAGNRKTIEELAGAATATRQARKAGAVSETTVLSVSNVTCSPNDGTRGIFDINIDIHAGEILGIAGIDGHGQSTLAEVLAGQRKLQSGSVHLGDIDVTHLDVRARQGMGLRYVTDDRLHEGIVGNLPVSLNLLLKRVGQKPFWNRGRINRQAVIDESSRLIKEFDIRTPSTETRAGTLSGGNIQKLLLARELSHNPKLVIFNKPTYGLDLKTVARVRETILDFANEGVAVLLISTDLDELIELSDRIAVVSQGRLIGETPNVGERTAEIVGEIIVNDGTVTTRKSGK